MEISNNAENSKAGLDTPGNALDTMTERYRRLLDIQDEIAAAVIIAKPEMTSEAVQQRLDTGAPLLAFEDFFPGWEHAEPAFRRVVEWADTENKHSWASLDINAARFQEMALAWYKTDTSSQQDGLSDELIAVVGTCLKPFLIAQSRSLMPLVDQRHWRQKTCPVCGGSADFGYLAREDGARWLLCSRCDGAWLFQRLACPQCGTQDQNHLAYLTDHTGRYRLYVCEACRTYLKAIDLRQVQHDVRLPLQRVMTLDLDQQAIARGYSIS